MRGREYNNKVNTYTQCECKRVALDRQKSFVCVSSDVCVCVRSAEWFFLGLGVLVGWGVRGWTPPPEPSPAAPTRGKGG